MHRRWTRLSLLHDTGSLPPGKAEELEALSRKRGMPLEWSFILDALQTERDQAITIDTTRVWFTWNDRRYAIIDAPDIANSCETC